MNKPPFMQRMPILIFVSYFIYLKFLQTHLYTVSLKDKCNVLCERTDNEAFGSKKELVVTLIKYNVKNIKTTVIITYTRLPSNDKPEFR